MCDQVITLKAGLDVAAEQSWWKSSYAEGMKLFFPSSYLGWGRKTLWVKIWAGTGQRVTGVGRNTAMAIRYCHYLGLVFINWQEKRWEDKENVCKIDKTDEAAEANTALTQKLSFPCWEEV